MVMHNKKLTMAKNTPPSLVISMAMAMACSPVQYGAHRSKQKV
jgi:hypothetical protein